mmetsp:Transcript_58696/g.88559  ORF Transcript_58696/g.88559 Transcript_58696/m.88559 type:complete len:91 (+) Transcript_58696:69-341(+)
MKNEEKSRKLVERKAKIEEIEQNDHEINYEKELEKIQTRSGTNEAEYQRSRIFSRFPATSRLGGDVSLHFDDGSSFYFSWEMRGKYGCCH